MMPIFVSHYTIGTPYEKEVELLKKSLEKFDLDFHIEGIISMGSWRENSNWCAYQVRELMDRYPDRSILRLDADAIIKKMPVVLRDIKEDVGAVFWKNSKLRKEGELLGGTLFFNCTEKTRWLVNKWVEAIERNPRVRNGDALQILLKENEDVKVKWLPLSYCCIFDSMRPEVPEPVILHNQASRRFKRFINKGGPSKMLSIDKLKTKVNSKVAVFLGSGASINNITPEQWEAIKKFDIWTVNNWVYHPEIVPKFYHVETKHYGFHILQRRFLEKWEQYKNVNFIFPKNRKIKVAGKGVFRLETVVPAAANIYFYDFIQRDIKRTDNPFHAKYTMKNNVMTKSYNMSVTLMMEMMYKMGYERIVTYGIDLNNSLYFWTGNDPKYGEVHHQTNKEHEGRPPDAPHATHQIKDFLIDFNEKWMKSERKELLVGHEDTNLYPGLNSVEITELKI
jgi:hypothetical protein